MASHIVNALRSPRDCATGVTTTLAVTGVPLRVWTLVHGGGSASVVPAVPAFLALMVVVYLLQAWAAAAGRTRALRRIAAVGLFGAGWLMTWQMVASFTVGNWWYWLGIVLVQGWLWWLAGERMRLRA